VMSTPNTCTDKREIRIRVISFILLDLFIQTIIEEFEQ
jgi:hypothetical protein